MTYVIDRGILSEALKKVSTPRGTADAEIAESGFLHLFRVEEITAVHKGRTGHERLEAF